MERSAGGPVAVATDLLEVLCELAADRDPESVTVPLGVSPVAEFDVSNLETDVVFTHFYLPETGRSVRAVFGIDLGTPSGATPGIFLAHPDGREELTKRDELREVSFVAVPPWEPEAVVAFDRRGYRRPLHALDITLPEESLP